MASDTGNVSFPCALTLSIPLPTHRLASYALRALQVDAELSPLVQRSFLLVSAQEPAISVLPLTNGIYSESPVFKIDDADDEATLTEENSILCVAYKATTNRMLRVAVNGFMESLGVVLRVMEELDVDALDEAD